MLRLGQNIPFPLRVYLDVTNYCPLNCKHCYADAGSPALDELSFDELKGIAEQIIALGIKNLVVSGGEPFSRKDIFEFLSFCTDKGLNVTVLTNGILIDSSKSKILKELNVEVRVSIDGVSAKTHDYVRGEGNFQLVLQALKNLKEAQVRRASLHFTVNRLNISEILLLPSFLNEAGIKDVVISTVKPIGRVLQHPELLIEPEIVLLVKERLSTISQNKSIKFHIYNNKNWEGLACPAAFVKCGITAEGRISPCVFLGPEFEGESIRKHSLEYLWRNDAMLTRLRSLSFNSTCSRCSEINSCNGGCRLRAMHYNGNLEAVDPYCCEMMKQKVLLKGLVA